MRSKPSAIHRVASFTATAALLASCGGRVATASPAIGVATPTASATPSAPTPTPARAPSPTPSPPPSHGPQSSGPPAPFGVARNGSFVYEMEGDIYLAD